MFLCFFFLKVLPYFLLIFILWSIAISLIFLVVLLSSQLSVIFCIYALFFFLTYYWVLIFISAELLLQPAQINYISVCQEFLVSPSSSLHLMCIFYPVVQTAKSNRSIRRIDSCWAHIQIYFLVDLCSSPSLFVAVYSIICVLSKIRRVDWFDRNYSKLVLFGYLLLVFCLLRCGVFYVSI